MQVLTAEAFFEPPDYLGVFLIQKKHLLRVFFSWWKIKARSLRIIQGSRERAKISAFIFDDIDSCERSFRRLLSFDFYGDTN